MKIQRREKRDQPAQPSSNWGAFAPFNQLSRIRSEINRIFEDPFSALSPNTSFFEGWQPTLDVYEDKDKLTVKAELPGLKKEDISVSLDQNTLTISGERKHEEEHKERDTYRSERYFGRFQRSVTLSHEVDAGKVQANYKDGVLTIMLPKSDKAKAKHIDIKMS